MVGMKKLQLSQWSGSKCGCEWVCTGHVGYGDRSALRDRLEGSEEEKWRVTPTKDEGG